MLGLKTGNCFCGCNAQSDIRRPARIIVHDHVIVGANGRTRMKAMGLF